MNEGRDKKKKKRNPLDEMMEELEKYSEGTSTEDLMSSGE